MMKITIILWSVLLLFSCRGRETVLVEREPHWIGVPDKLSGLQSLPPDTVLAYYDLSEAFLLDFPDLSAYTIRSLNLSHNYLDTVILSFLPKGLEKLDLSYNYLRRFPRNDTSRTLQELNISYNHINNFGPYFFINHLDISHNDLTHISFYWTYGYYYGYSRNKKPMRMNYLNLSDNPGLSNKVMFVPSYIDTIIHDRIANDKKLEMIDWRMRIIR